MDETISDELGLSSNAGVISMDYHVAVRVICVCTSAWALYSFPYVVMPSTLSSNEADADRVHRKEGLEYLHWKSNETEGRMGKKSSFIGLQLYASGIL